MSVALNEKSGKQKNNESWKSRMREWINKRSRSTGKGKFGSHQAKCDEKSNETRKEESIRPGHLLRTHIGTNEADTVSQIDFRHLLRFIPTSEILTTNSENEPRNIFCQFCRKFGHLKEECMWDPLTTL